MMNESAGPLNEDVAHLIERVDAPAEGYEQRLQRLEREIDDLRVLLDRAVAHHTGSEPEWTPTADGQMQGAASFRSTDSEAPAVLVEGRDGTPGLYAHSAAGDGMIAESNTGAAVFATSHNGEGVVAESSAGTAIVATSTYGDGMLITSTHGNGLIVRTDDTKNCAIGVMSIHGVAVQATSADGYGGEFKGGQAAVRLMPASTSGPPADGFHAVGELLLDRDGTLFLCIADGIPGTWRRILIGPTPTGSGT